MSLRIYGAGGFGRETAACALAQGCPVAEFIDDHVTGPVMGIEVRPAHQVLSNSQMVVAIADPATRERIVTDMNQIFTRWVNVIDPSTTWLDTCTLGAGIIVLPHVHVSVSATLEDHVQVNYGATIGHDVQIGAFSTVLPGANIAGSVTIGRRVTVGSGAVILQGLTIGDDAVIGAGAVVTRDVPPSTTVVGVPARPVER